MRELESSLEMENLLSSASNGVGLMLGEKSLSTLNHSFKVSVGIKYKQCLISYLLQLSTENPKVFFGTAQARYLRPTYDFREKNFTLTFIVGMFINVISTSVKC